MRRFGAATFAFLFWAGPIWCGAEDLLSHVSEANPTVASARFLTNAAQFSTLSGADFLGRCAFRLTGIVTLVDSNRELVVVQDATAALALHFGWKDQKLKVGQRVTLEGANCFPYLRGLPDYPYQPSGREIRDTFEGPRDWGEYYLSRMQGFLHPPATGDYTFWIASDNSSELWLSSDADPTKAKRIAYVSRYAWTAPREWSRFPSQRSETVRLEAGATYYIEALQEQTTAADHVAVAWQGPSLKQGVIDGRYLSPWGAETPDQGAADTNRGILREYWTNFTAGDLSVLARPFESAISVERVAVRILGEGSVPSAEPLVLSRRWTPANNYRWGQVEGWAHVRGTNGGVTFLELVNEDAVLEVRALRWDREWDRLIQNSAVRVEGVCEGLYDTKGNLMPALIWISTADGISRAGILETRGSDMPVVPSLNPSATPTNTSMQGFYGTRGVVTYNGCVLGKDYLIVQEENGAIRVSLQNRHFKNDLEVGDEVDLGGTLMPGRNIQTIDPLVVVKRGWRSMPKPITEPIQPPVPGNRDGKWTEVEGVVRNIHPNGTCSLVGAKGSVDLWLGQLSSNSLARYVDARICAQGVLTLTILPSPLLLVPSPAFLTVKEAAPVDPFDIAARIINAAKADGLESIGLHRVKVAGTVTACDGDSFFLQDPSGGIRVEPENGNSVEVGETVQVVGFPTTQGPRRILSDALVRRSHASQTVTPNRLALDEALSFNQVGLLVEAWADVLGQKTVGNRQILELQEQQRVFPATLLIGSGRLPAIPPGSRVKVVGVCDNQANTTAASAGATVEGVPVASLNLWLRSPADVTILRGPRWWTWRRAAALVGALMAVLMGTSLWVFLLRRRLARQKRLQFAFSRQILESLESERRRIAVNLHDSLGQILLAIKNQSVLAAQRAPEEPALRHRLDEISAATSQAIEEVRQITRGLRPYQLDRLGLTQAIRATVELASANSSIVFASRVDDIDRVFDGDSEIHVYRIVQEAVNNVIKHSAATEATVVVKKLARNVSLSIRDNGRGFDAGSAPASEPHDLGYGLSGIAERVRILGGNLTVDSKPGEGTSLTVEVPAPIHNHDTRSDSDDRG